jgi:DNA topoisomerase-3
LKMLQQSLKNGTGTIVDKTVEDKKEYPPYLFNLSNLQGYITNKYKGWTSSKVLKVAQALYEKKLITYPRTASSVLDESLIDKASKVLGNLKKGLPYEQEIKFTRSKRVFDSSKVDSHSAITPTYVLPKSLTPDEKVVYTAIKNRFIMQFMPDSESQETKIVTKLVDDSVKGIFVTKGKTLLVEGWKKVEKIETKEAILPNVNKNDDVTVKDFKLSSHKTTPPKYHTEKTLLRVMETCGKGQEYEDSEGMMDAILRGYSIGTPATRAETIQKLKLVGYIEQQNKNLTCSELGRKLVEIFPVAELFDLEFTGRLEKTLLDIEKQRFKKEDFLKLITEFTTTAVMKIKNHEAVIINESQAKRAETKILGKCPVCGNAIIEGSKGYGCSNWKNGCKFVIWKNDKFLAAMKKKPTQTMVKTLLKEGSVTVKGLTSKKGNKFDAKLRYEKNADNDYFSWKMEFLKGS